MDKALHGIMLLRWIRDTLADLGDLRVVKQAEDKAGTVLSWWLPGDA